jgi:WD40 repeat protein
VRVLEGHTEPVWSLAFSPGGKTLASGSADTTIVLWDVAHGTDVRTLTGHAGGPAAVVFSPDGRTLAAGGDGGTVRLWDTATGRQTDLGKRHKNLPVRAVAFSPDGKRLASAGHDQTVQVYEPAAGRRLFALREPGSGLISLAFSPDGKWLAAGSTSPNDSLRLWDVDTKQEVGALKGAGPLGGLAFQPGGKRIATGSSNGVLQIWEPTGQGYQPRAIGPGPFGDSLYGVAFTPDGRYLAAAAGNGAFCILRLAEPGP